MALSSHISLATAALLLISLQGPPLAHASPEPAATDLWVTVEDGQPSTVTPVLTTISGIETVINAAPDNVTQTVFTRTENGALKTTTNTAPIATATESDGDGAFVLCKNTDGGVAPVPFCPVAGGQALVVGGTYYISWDPTFYAANSTVEIIGNFFNVTTGLVEKQAFASGERDAKWGFWAWTADSSILGGSSNITVALTIAAVEPGSDVSIRNDGPKLVVKTPDVYKPEEPTMNKRALLIGLPVSVGLVFFITIGICVWNRKERQINIKNIMGRGKRGYGISKSRLQRLGGRGGGGGGRSKGQDIPLMDRNGERADAEIYRDIHDPYSAYPTGPRARTPGRNPSEDLGSLAGGSPSKKEGFKFGLGQGAGRNAFREEIERQNRDKLA